MITDEYQNSISHQTPGIADISIGFSVNTLASSLLLYDMPYMLLAITDHFIISTNRNIKKLYN